MDFLQFRDIRLYGDFTPGKDRAPIVSFIFGNYDSGEVADELYERYGISSRQEPTVPHSCTAVLEPRKQVPSGSVSPILIQKMKSTCCRSRPGTCPGRLIQKD